MKIGAGFMMAWLLLATPAAAERLGVLEGVYKPQMIKVDGGELFVAEGNFIHVFSLPGLERKFRVGKDGEGPGEFKLDPARTIIFSVHPRFILAESRNKIVFFDRTGRFIKERRKQPGILQVLPLGDNYAVLHLRYGAEGESYFLASVMDRDFRRIREVYRQEFFNFKNRIHVLPDGLNICVAGKRLYVDESPEGFRIGVYNDRGEQVGRIRAPFTPVAVTAAMRREGLADLLQIPALRRATAEQGRARVLADLEPNLLYPEFLPALDALTVAGGRLYVRTSLRRDGRSEFRAFRPDGSPAGVFSLPAAQKVDFLVRMQGDKNYFTFSGDRYYYLRRVDTDDDEAWEVHAESLNPSPRGDGRPAMPSGA